MYTSTVFFLLSSVSVVSVAISRSRERALGMLIRGNERYPKRGSY